MKSILLTLLLAFIPAMSFAQKDSGLVLTGAKPPLVINSINPLLVHPIVKTNSGNGPDTNKRIIHICAPSKGQLLKPPLYVLYAHNKLVYRSDTAKTPNAIYLLNPKLIKTITILKGAGATAKYGSTAINGVIEVFINHRYKNISKLFKADTTADNSKRRT